MSHPPKTNIRKTHVTHHGQWRRVGIMGEPVRCYTTLDRQGEMMSVNVSGERIEMERDGK